MTNAVATVFEGLRARDRRRFHRMYGRFFLLATLFVSIVPGLAPIKLLAISALWFLLVFGGDFTISAALWFTSITMNLLVGMEVGVVRGVPLGLILDHGVRLFTFFVSLGIGCYTAANVRFTRDRLDHLLFLLTVGLMLFKLGIVVAVLTGSSLDRIQELFGFDTVTSDIGFGLQRLQFPSDILVPMLVACYQGGKTKVKDGFLLLSAICVILLSFSRFLFGFYLLCTFVRAIWIRKADFITMLNVAITVICAAVFFNSLLLRFAGASTDASDQVRVDQIHYLKIGIQHFPLLGTGIGSEAHDYLRSEKTPYFYEAQWYATTMQLGFIGVFWYAANLLLAVYIPLRANIVPFSLIFAAWVASGFTNPFLTALGSAFGLSLLLIRCNIAEQQPIEAAIA